MQQLLGQQLSQVRTLTVRRQRHEYNATFDDKPRAHAPVPADVQTFVY